MPIIVLFFVVVVVVCVFSTRNTEVRRFEKKNEKYHYVRVVSRDVVKNRREEKKTHTKTPFHKQLVEKAFVLLFTSRPPLSI